MTRRARAPARPRWPSLRVTVSLLEWRKADLLCGCLAEIPNLDRETATDADPSSLIPEAVVACHPAKGFSAHGCGGVRPGTKGGNGVAVDAGVAVAAGTGVATWACTRAKKVTKPIRTHTLRKAIPDHIRVLTVRCPSRMDLFFIAEVSTK